MSLQENIFLIMLKDPSDPPNGSRLRLNGFIPFCGTRDFVGGSSLVSRPNVGSFRLFF